MQPPISLFFIIIETKISIEIVKTIGCLRKALHTDCLDDFETNLKFMGSFRYFPPLWIR